MSNKKRIASLAVALAFGALSLQACADNSSTADSNSNGDTGSALKEDNAADQPDVNGDGKIKIGVISPGDTNDNGYYEEFVVAARAYTDEQGWELTVVDQVNDADAANQARNLCRQNMDLIAIAAAESKDAIPVADEPGCSETVFALFGDLTGQYSDSIAQVTGQNYQTQYLVGRATGELLKSEGASVAGYVAGPELDFSATAAKGYETGIKSVVPDAKVLVTYTGSFDDGGKAREAVISQTGQGAKVVYTYLGGATDSAASAAKEHGAFAISPGTDRCDDDRFGISGLFAPGLYFENLLRDFSEGLVEVGTMITYEVGVDPAPTAKVCDAVDGAADIQKEVDDAAAQIASGELDIGER